MCTNENLLSEMKEKYQNPKLKKPKSTWSNRFEQFLWQELYDEYIRYNQKILESSKEKANSEYFDEFCKNTLTEDEEAKEALMHRYPLYSTNAITLWNHNDLTKNFRKRYAITRPVQEQTEQFG